MTKLERTSDELDPSSGTTIGPGVMLKNGASLTEVTETVKLFESVQFWLSVALMTTKAVPAKSWKPRMVAVFEALSIMTVTLPEIIAL